MVLLGTSRHVTFLGYGREDICIYLARRVFLLEWRAVLDWLDGFDVWAISQRIEGTLEEGRERKE